MKDRFIDYKGQRYIGAEERNRIILHDPDEKWSLQEIMRFEEEHHGYTVQQYEKDRAHKRNKWLAEHPPATQLTFPFEDPAAEA